MRQLLVQVPKRHGERIIELAEKYEPVNTSRFTVITPQGTQCVVILHIPNRAVGGLLDDLSVIPEGQITLDPHEILTMQPPDEQVADSIAEISRRSPIEVWLNGLQSIGSWKSFISYALAAGLVVWIALFTNTIYLLVAAMLIAPFGGPAMNASLASASGDGSLLRSSVVRYGAGLIVLILTTFVVSLVMQLEQVTSLMLDVGQLSAVAVLLPVVTGAIGALNLVESERSSLVPGTAVGLLVAASLAPPAGVAGMTLALQNWAMVWRALFVLALQLVMINLSGALVFRYYGGLTPEGSRYQRGKSAIFTISLAVSFLVGAGLLWVQFQNTPELQRSTRAQRAVSIAQQVINESELASYVAAEFRYTEPMQQSEEILLGTLYVQRGNNVSANDDEIEEQLIHQIRQALQQNGFKGTKLLTITVLEAI